MEWSVTDLPFSGGLDTGTDDKIVPIGQFRELVNCDLDNRVGLLARHGYDVLPQDFYDGDTEIDAPTIDQLYTRGEDLLAHAGGSLYRWTGNYWLRIGDYLKATLETRPLSAASTLHAFPTTSADSGVQITAWEEGNDIYYQLDKDGAVVIPRAQLDTSADNPLVCVNGDNAAVIHANSNQLRSSYFSATDPASRRENEVIVEDVHSNHILDIARWPTNDRFVVVYATDSNVIRAILFNSSGEPVAGEFPQVVELASESVPITSLSVTTSDSKIGLAYRYTSGGSNSLVFKLYDLDGTLTFTDTISPTHASICGCSVTWNGSTFTLFDSRDGTYFGGSGLRALSYSSTGVVVSDLFSRGDEFCLAGTFSYNGRSYCLSYFETDLQAQYGIFSDKGELVGCIAYGLAGGEIRSNSVVDVDSEGRAYFAFLQKKRVDIPDDGTVTYTDPDVHIGTLDFSSTPGFAENNEILHLGGPLSCVYDGVSLYEQGFCLFPEGVVDSEIVTVSPFAAGEQRVYYVVYERELDNGTKVVSAGIPVTHTQVTTGRAVQLTIPTISCLSKDNTTVSIAVYRTENNGTTAYRCSSLNPSSGGSNGYLANDATVATATFVDVLSDTNLRKNELYYGNVEVLNDPATPYSAATTGKQRVFIGFNDKVYYSKLPVDNRATEFSLAFEEKVDERSGRITALAVQDNLLVVFKEKAIFLVTGEGANNTGTGDFDEPRLLTDQLGVSNQTQVIETPIGIVFKSNKGIYALNKNFQLDYIGENVKRYDTSTVTGIVNIPDRDQILFLLAEDFTTLVYDYGRKQWATYYPYSGPSVAIYQDVPVYVDSFGRVLKGNPSKYLDGDTPYSMSFTLPWLSANNLQGFQRVRRMSLLGKKRSDHFLRIFVYYNYSAAYQYYFEHTPSVNEQEYGEGFYGEFPYGGTGSEVEQVRHRLVRQKCTAVSFKVDVIPTTEGPGFEPVGLSLELGMKEGLSRLSSARTA